MKRMQKFTFWMAMLSMLIATGGTGMGQTPLGTEFTYQGHLDDAGQPANGNYDMEFRLHDADIFGNQIGATDVLNNVSVVDGRFTVELDFGADAFDGDERWIQVKVENAFLVPRQLITATPYSTKTRGIHVNDDESFVGIGRDSAVNSEEFFGVNAAVSSGFGGMYVRTDGGNAKPFYGYTTSSGATARHYFDGDTNSWNLRNGAVQMTVNESGGFFASETGTGFFNLAVFPTGDIGIGNIAGLDFRLNVLEDGYVGIGRDTPVVPSTSYFDVQTPVGNNQFGGMHIATDTEGGIPYYGYAAGGTTDAFTYFNGGTSDWGLRIGIQTPILVKGTTGRVGLSTFNPTALLDVNGSARVRSSLTVDIDSCFKPGGGPWSMSSDRRLKKNINDLEGSLDKLMKLRGVTFEYIDPKSINELEGERVGMIAQEVEKIFPDWVGKKDDGYKSLTPRGFEALAVEALRELRSEKDAQIKALKVEKDEQISALETENDDLRERLESLEAAVQSLAQSQQQ